MSDIDQFVNTCTDILSEDISREECEILSLAFQVRKLGAGEALLREGEKDDALYIIIEGDIVVTRDAGGGEHVTLQHLKPGDVAGAMGFIDNTSHSATVSAAGESHVLELHRDALESMIDEHPRLMYKIMKMIIKSVHRTMLQMNRQFVEMNNYIMKEHGRY
ncbi:MAG TPA: cyclic nucleotide-binding domain-containing protein [Gammaproteobacteria bacterium]|nr:cyclic nucleotide-binding domain-containing protein [Gammaproteobacteria bacterium]